MKSIRVAFLLCLAFALLSCTTTTTTRSTTNPNPPVPENHAPTFISYPVTVCEYNEMYSYTIEVSGYPQPIISILSMPSWMSFNPDTRTLSGVPHTTGVSEEVRVLASNGVEPNALHIFSINLWRAQVPPSIGLTNANTSLYIGADYKNVVSCGGFPEPTITVSGLPSWLTYDGNSIQGYPKLANMGESATITIAATNGVDPAAVRILNLSVLPVIPQCKIVNLSTGLVECYDSVPSDLEPNDDYRLHKIVFTKINPGTFEIGNRQVYEEGERPLRNVRITKAFYMAVFETTRQQWYEIMGLFYMNVPNPIPVQPVSLLTYNDVMEASGFIDAFNQRVSGLYDLPTEAQWEYACRAGNQSVTFFGNTLSNTTNIYLDKFLHSFPSLPVTQPIRVGSLACNSFGLYDMHGNASEMTKDTYELYFYASLRSDVYNEDPYNDSVGDYYSLRGGSCLNLQYDCRSSIRWASTKNSGGPISGFRMISVIE